MQKLSEEEPESLNKIANSNLATKQPLPGHDDRDSQISSKIKNINGIIKEFISGRMPANKNKNGLRETVEEIIGEIEENQIDGAETVISSSERSILKNVIEFSELHVEDIIIPRADIFAVAYDTDVEKLQAKFVKKTFTRIPVYKRNLDEIIGFLHIKDIAKSIFEKKDFNLNEILRDCLFVPPSMKVSNLLIKMQLTHIHLAIVVDEYGGTLGLVTLEDLLEEIVGKIEDEHDTEKGFTFSQISENVYEVNSRLTIDDFEAKTGIKLVDGEEKEISNFDTIGGLIFTKLGKIPAIGEIASFDDNIEFEITNADARSLKRIIVRKKNA